MITIRDVGRFIAFLACFIYAIMMTDAVLTFLLIGNVDPDDCVVISSKLWNDFATNKVALLYKAVVCVGLMWTSVMSLYGFYTQNVSLMTPLNGFTAFAAIFDFWTGVSDFSYKFKLGLILGVFLQVFLMFTTGPVVKNADPNCKQMMSDFPEEERKEHSFQPTDLMDYRRKYDVAFGNIASTGVANNYLYGISSDEGEDEEYSGSNSMESLDEKSLARKSAADTNDTNLLDLTQ